MLLSLANVVCLLVFFVFRDDSIARFPFPVVDIVMPDRRQSSECSAGCRSTKSDFDVPI